MDFYRQSIRLLIIIIIIYNVARKTFFIPLMWLLLPLRLLTSDAVVSSKQSSHKHLHVYSGPVYQSLMQCGVMSDDTRVSMERQVSQMEYVVSANKTPPADFVLSKRSFINRYALCSAVCWNSIRIFLQSSSPLTHGFTLHCQKTLFPRNC